MKRYECFIKFVLLAVTENQRVSAPEGAAPVGWLVCFGQVTLPKGLKCYLDCADFVAAIVKPCLIVNHHALAGFGGTTDIDAVH